MTATQGKLAAESGDRSGRLASEIDALLDGGITQLTRLTLAAEGRANGRTHDGMPLWLTLRTVAHAASVGGPRYGPDHERAGRLSNRGDKALARIANCCRGGGQVASIDRVKDPETGTWRSSLSRCWSCEDVRCVRCGAQARAAKAAVISAAAAQWHVDGGRLYLATLTVRHSLDSTRTQADLDRYYGALSSSWSAMMGTLRRKAPRYREIHYTRVIEETIGPAGWHPHIHAAIFVPSGCALSAKRIQAAMGSLWRRHITSRLGDWATPGRYGVRVQAWRPRYDMCGEISGSVASVGAYLWGLGAEVHGATPTGRLKTGHSYDSDGPVIIDGIEVERDVASRGVPVWVRASQGRHDEWVRWVRVTAARQLATSSNGWLAESKRLAARWHADHPQPTDTREREPVVELGGAALEWLQAIPHRWSEFRDSCDRGAASAAAWLLMHAPDDLDDRWYCWPSDHRSIGMDQLVRSWGWGGIRTVSLRSAVRARLLALQA